MLKGQQVGLRAIERDDPPQLLSWRNRPEYRRFFRECRERNFEQQLRWFENTVLGDHNTIMFSIIELSTNRLLGSCGLCYINWIHRNADFSIYIGADNLYIDDLYADDAGFVMARYAFEELGLHRLWSEIYDFDEDKKNFFNRLGFKLDGNHRETYWYDGRWHNSLFYSVLVHEFKDKFDVESQSRSQSNAASRR